MTELSSEPRLDTLVSVIANLHADVIIVGGVAMILLGADYLTIDFDVCYRRESETIARLCDALAPHSAFLRSAFLVIQNALLTENMALNTDFGRIGLMGSLTGIGDYEAVAKFAVPVRVDDLVVNVLGLEGLIAAKEAVLRDKDKLHLATLKALKALRDEQGPA